MRVVFADPTKLVLPVRIELTTSPLPRECSTTELRQQAEVKNHAAEAVHRLDEIARRCLPYRGMAAQASGQWARRHCRASAGVLFASAMAIGGNTGKSGTAVARAARKARLAAALRENLKRRKQQARQRAVAHKTPALEAPSQHAKPEPDAPDFRRNRDKK